MIKVCQVASGSSLTDLKDMVSPWGEYDLSYACDEKTDFIIGWSVSTMDQTLWFHRLYPKAKLITYNWDVYEWVWTRPRKGEYDYAKYGEQMRQSVETWVPSECTGKRMEEWYKINNYKVIHSSVPYYDEPVSDEGYVLNALRDLPDRNEGWAEKACSELNIPYKRPNHGLKQADFQKVVANCRFIVNAHYEGSTGGLSLMEAYYLGKPGLIADSPYMGGNEYLKDRVTTFKHDDYGDFKQKLKEMWENPPEVADDHKEFIKLNYSKAAMGKKIHERLQALYES